MNQNDFIRQISHADVLLSQGRFDQAEAILDKLLATDIELFEVQKMMAIAKLGLGKYQEAEELCQYILTQSPNEAFVFYMLATIKANKRLLGEALNLISEAIRLEPINPAFFAFKANILIQTKDFQDALHAAEIGLKLDAEDIDALNARATALVGLGRKDEAFQTIEKSLAVDPNNSETHTNMGWGLLHHGDSNQALQHFKEALKENPLNEYAKAGMLEAMKSKFPVYRYFLMLMLWLSKFKGNAQWTMIIGSYIAYRILVSLASNNEALQPFLIPLIVLIALFFISTWIFSPLMDLYMLTNTYGKLTLTAEQKESARLVGLALSICIVSLIIGVLTNNQGFYTLSLLSFAMMICLGTMNKPLKQKYRRNLKIATIAIAIFCLLDSILAISQQTFMTSMSLIPIAGIIIYQWYTNYVLIKE